MGKLLGSTRSATSSVSGGNDERASATRESTSGCAFSMSVSGEKKSDSSTAPRMVLLRTCVTPGMRASSSSSGRVSAGEDGRRGRAGKRGDHLLSREGHLRIHALGHLPRRPEASGGRRDRDEEQRAPVAQRHRGCAHRNAPGACAGWGCAG